MTPCCMTSCLVVSIALEFCGGDCAVSSAVVPYASPTHVLSVCATSCIVVIKGLTLHTPGWLQEELLSGAPFSFHQKAILNSHVGVLWSKEVNDGMGCALIRRPPFNEFYPSN